jgi:hypothetical protein
MRTDSFVHLLGFCYEKHLAPLQMDGWEIALITVFSVVGALALYFIFKQPSVTSGVGSGLYGVIYTISNFLPYGILLFGFFADVIGQEFRYSIASFTGLLAILLNYALKPVLERVFTGAPASSSVVDERGWCTLPGLEALESRATPMSIVSSSAIITYLLIFAWIDRPASDNIAISVLLPVILIVQMFTFHFSGCSPYYNTSSLMGGFSMAMMLGAIVGTSLWAAINFGAPQYSPFSKFIPTFAATTAGKGGGVGATRNGGSNGATGGKCSQVGGSTDDDNAYVCEAYKNGQLVTQTISS